MAREVIPVATEMEHADTYPEAIVEQMKALGLFGITIPEEYGGLGLDLLSYIGVVEELAYGWMSLSGIVNTHTIAAHLIVHHGTEEQKQRFLPRMATGEIRGCLSLSESDAGSDTRNLSCKAVRDGDEYVVDRHEDVGHQRRARRDRRARGAHRRGHLVPHRREGTGPEVRGHHGEQEHREARLQGDRDRRDGLRRPPRPGDARCSAIPAAASATSSARSRSAGSTSRRARSAWPGPRSTPRSRTRRSAARWASRSPSTRRSR